MLGSLDIEIEEAYIEGAGFIEMAAGGSGSGYWEWRRVKEDKYIDKYFEKNLGDHTRTHIFLNASIAAAVIMNEIKKA